MDKNVIKLSTVLLNWNRIDLLRTTVKSYLATVKENYELIIIDNNSTDGSRDFIEEICIANSKHRAILLDQNLGGEALNLGIEIANGEFIHVSENDLEYLSGWDSELLSKFMNFPELGQLSVFSPFHQVEIGEIWEDKPAIKTEQNGKIIFLALANVGTSSIFRKEIWQAGIRWGSVGSSTYRAPDDGVFSKEVKKIGYKVAWNDKYVVINWGHNIAEMKNRIEYYLNNVEGKASLGVTGYLKSLNEHGFHAIKHSNGKITLKQELPFK